MYTQNVYFKNFLVFVSKHLNTKIQILIKYKKKKRVMDLELRSIQGYFTVGPLRAGRSRTFSGVFKTETTDRTGELQHLIDGGTQDAKGPAHIH